MTINSFCKHKNNLFMKFRKLLRQVSEITIDDIKRVGPLYVPALFDTKKSWLAVCCHPSKVDEIVAGFKEYVYTTKHFLTYQHVISYRCDNMVFFSSSRIDRDLSVITLEKSLMDSIDINLL